VPDLLLDPEEIEDLEEEGEEEEVEEALIRSKITKRQGHINTMGIRKEEPITVTSSSQSLKHTFLIRTTSKISLRQLEGVKSMERS
jgi:hypothetical protein